MASEPDIRRRQTTGLGRSGPRSKTGCQTCKVRRVRCDEKHPVCGHCNRLHLECDYKPPQRRGRPLVMRDIVDPVSGHLQEPIHNHHTPPSHHSPAGVPEHQEGSVHGHDAGTRIASPHGGPNPDVLHVNHDINHNGGGNSLLDAVSGETPNVPLSGSGNIGTLPDASGEGAMSWKNGIFNNYMDYIPVPDPPFSFTSLAFGNSRGFFDLSGNDSVPGVNAMSGVEPTQAWFSEVSDAGVFTPETGTLPLLDQDTAEPSHTATTAVEANSSVARSPGGNSPMILAPLLSTTQQEMLFTHFQRDCRPPASLAGIDPLGWLQIKSYLLRKAKGGEEVVTHAFFALNTLLSALDLTFQSSINRYNYKLLAISLQQASCSSMESNLRRHDWVEKNSQNLLVAVFLLTWFEIAYDDEDQGRPSFPTDMAAKIIVEGRGWNHGSRRLLQWLNLMDSKISHLGGRTFFSDAALRVIRQSRSESSYSEAADGEDWDIATAFSPLAQLVSSDQKAQQASADPNRKDRLGYLLSRRVPATLPGSLIRMDIFNIILHPALEFHLTSMTYARRIGRHDRHHRARETPEDEFEVMTACRAFEEELQDLWQRRPGILNLDASQLKVFVSEEIARGLELLFSVYIATFWSHFIYIHRVAFWNLKHTVIVSKAIEETGNMMRRSVGQAIDKYAFDRNIARTPANTIHPGLMWTCLIFGCEVPDPVQQEWCVLQLRALGELDVASCVGSPDPMEDLLSFRLDTKGAQNALKVSKVLKVVIEKQQKAKARVDGKFVSQELFGCPFYMI